MSVKTQCQVQNVKIIDEDEEFKDKVINTQQL